MHLTQRFGYSAWFLSTVAPSTLKPGAREVDRQWRTLRTKPLATGAEPGAETSEQSYNSTIE